MDEIRKLITDDFPGAEINFGPLDGHKECFATIVVPTNFIIGYMRSKSGNTFPIYQKAFYAAYGSNGGNALFNAYIIALRANNMHGHTR